MEASLNLLDNTFSVDNWTERLYNFSHIPCDTTGKCSSTQTKTGGPNKTPFRQTYHSWSSIDDQKTFIVALHLSELCKINLNATGKLNKVGYSFQAMSLVGNIIFGFVVFQNDILYITKTNLIKKSFQWNLVEKMNLTSEDFKCSEGTNPNFTKGKLEFGYITMCSTDGGSAECISGLGNLNLKLTFEENPLQRLQALDSSKLDVESFKKLNKKLENDLKVEETKFFEANFKLEKLTKKHNFSQEELEREKLKSDQLQISFELLTKQLSARNKEVKKLHEEVQKLQQKIDEVNEMNFMKIEIETNEICHHKEHQLNNQKNEVPKIEKTKIISLDSLIPNVEKINIEDLIKNDEEEEDGFVNIESDRDIILKELEEETKILMKEREAEKKERKSNYTRKVIGVKKNEEASADGWELMIEHQKIFAKQQLIIFGYLYDSNQGLAVDPSRVVNSED
eukprot:gene6913-11076_t